MKIFLLALTFSVFGCSTARPKPAIAKPVACKKCMPCPGLDPLENLERQLRESESCAANSACVEYLREMSDLDKAAKKTDPDPLDSLERRLRDCHTRRASVTLENQHLQKTLSEMTDRWSYLDGAIDEAGKETDKLLGIKTGCPVQKWCACPDIWFGEKGLCECSLWRALRSLCETLKEYDIGGPLTRCCE